MNGRHRAIRVALWLLALAALIALVLRADYSADMSVFLPRSPTPEQALLVDQLREGAVSRLILVGIAGGSESGRTAVSRAMAATLRGQSAFSSVVNGDDERLAADRRWLLEHRYLLSSRVDAERFGVPGLRAAVQDTLDWLASPAGMLIEPLVPRDPTGELIQILESLDSAAQPRRADGVWVSRDGREALMLALTRASGADIDAQAEALGRIDAAFAAAVAEVPGAGELHLEMTGPGVFAVESRATIKGEVTRIALLASVLIVALLLAIFRSLPLVLLALAPVLTGALAGIAAVSLGFGVVHGLTIGFGVTLIGEAVDYSIYLFVQGGAAADDPGADPASALLWPTIRLGVLTSVCGFGVMLASGFPGLAQLGLYSTVGLVSAALVTRLVLPALLPSGIKRRDFSRAGAWLLRATRRLAGLRWLVPVLCVAAILVVWQHRDRLWNDSLLALSPISPAAQALDARLRGELGAPDAGVVIVVDAPDRETALRQSELLAATLETLVTERVIAGWDSPARYLPSLATQQARLASLPDTRVLAARLEVATETLPLKAERLQPFLADVAAARASGPVGPETLGGTSFELAVDAMLYRGESRWRALLPLKSPSANDGAFDPEAVRRAIAAAPIQPDVGVHLLDLKQESDALYADYLGEAVWLSVIGLLAIVVVLAVALRSARRVWRVLLPLGAAVLVVVAGLVLAGESLILLHLVGLLLVVAVGSNYALFFVRASEDAAGPPPRVLVSLLFANLTTLLGFGLLATSTVPVLRAIGLTVGPGALLALVFAAMLSSGNPVSSAANGKSVDRA